MRNTQIQNPLIINQKTSRKTGRVNDQDSIAASLLEMSNATLYKQRTIMRIAQNDFCFDNFLGNLSNNIFFGVLVKQQGYAALTARHHEDCSK